MFKRHEYLVLDPKFSVIFKEKRYNDIYVVFLEKIDSNILKCLKVSNNDPWLYHRRFCHFNMDLLNEISKKDLVTDLPKIKFEKDKICDTCQFKNKSKFF